MNLQPVYPARHPEIILFCSNCRRHTRSPETFADLDATPGTYLCVRCALRFGRLNRDDIRNAFISRDKREQSMYSSIRVTGAIERGEGAAIVEQRASFNDSQFDEFVHGYLTCALWASTDDHGEPLDAVYSIDDIASDAVKSATADCRDFVDANSADVAVFADKKSWSAAGNDFWLTRNGHGTGFWDRGLGKVGDRLTAAAKVYGPSDMYVGDDGHIYL